MKNVIKNIKINFNNNLKTIKKDVKKQKFIKNPIIITFETIIYFIMKKVFRKEIDKLNYTKKYSNNLIIKSFISIIAATISIFIIFITFKISAQPKESYGDYEITYKENITKNDEKQTNNEETKNIEKIERVSANAIDEELAAQSSYKNSTYKFNINRTITTKEKVHLFSSENWADYFKIIDENTKLNVNIISSPGGYIMYQISDGEYAGKFITANKKLVETVEILDTNKLDFIDKKVAIKAINNATSYSNQILTTPKAFIAKDSVINIDGLGISENNRIIYYLSDKSFVPVDNSKVIEVARPTEQDKKKEKEQEKSQDKNTNKKTTNKKLKR